MPLYEYKCTQCGHEFEALQKAQDAPLGKCPKCGGPLRKLISSPAIQFKGNGWYITDYAKRSGQSSETKSETKAGTRSEAKPEPAKDKKAEVKPSTPAKD